MTTDSEFPAVAGFLCDEAPATTAVLREDIKDTLCSCCSLGHCRKGLNSVACSIRIHRRNAQCRPRATVFKAASVEGVNVVDIWTQEAGVNVSR